jgi:uncharacterized protein YndB with AHSA1/START domain
MSATPASPPSDAVTVSVTVPTDPASAFAIFTEESDLWWRRGPRFRVAGRNPGVLWFEPGVGGRLLETFEKSNGAQVRVMGTITAWEPPARFAFQWRASNFAAGESTDVEVRFEEYGSGTRVTVHHRGWAKLRKDHPVRHGQEGSAFIRRTGLWWGDLMTSFREHVVAKLDG